MTTGTIKWMRSTMRPITMRLMVKMPRPMNPNVNLPQAGRPFHRIFPLRACAGVVFLAVGIISAQTTTTPPSKNAVVFAELAKAPKKAVARPNPLEADPDAVKAGAKLFAMHCAECHGEMAEGEKKAPTLFAPEVQQAPPGALFWLLTNGVVRHGMPVWSKLPEPQRWQLVSFIKSLSPSAHPAEEAGKPSHP
jgi:mono/diheme cytochrome c family protein